MGTEGDLALFVRKRCRSSSKCFSNGPLETKIIGIEIGKASALKICYAAYSKGTTALLSAVLATAESLGVREELYQQWEMDDKGFSEQANRRITHVTAKAWRFEGEMKEIASTLSRSWSTRRLPSSCSRDLSPTGKLQEFS